MARNHSSITGPKMLPMNAVPLRWTRNRPTRIAMLIGTTSGRELGRVELETLDGAEHRDGRRDDPIAIEEGGPDQTDDHQGGAPTAARRMANVEKRQQRDDAALAAVVGAHDQDGIFERDDQDQRPEDDGHDAHSGFGRDRSRCVGGLLEPIEHAGADVAVDDAERRESGSGGQQRAPRRGSAAASTIFSISASSRL